MQYLGQHFDEVGAPASDFIDLVEEGWLRAWEAFEGSYHGFMKDVRRAVKAVAQRGTAGEPTGAWQLRCALGCVPIASATAHLIRSSQEGLGHGRTFLVERRPVGID